MCFLATITEIVAVGLQLSTSIYTINWDIIITVASVDNKLLTTINVLDK